MPRIPVRQIIRLIPYIGDALSLVDLFRGQPFYFKYGRRWPTNHYATGPARHIIRRHTNTLFNMGRELAERLIDKGRLYFQRKKGGKDVPAQFNPSAIIGKKVPWSEFEHARLSCMYDIYQRLGGNITTVVSLLPANIEEAADSLSWYNAFIQAMVIHVADTEIMTGYSSLAELKDKLLSVRNWKKLKVSFLRRSATTSSASGLARALVAAANEIYNDESQQLLSN